MDLRGRSLLKEIDFTKEELVYLVELARRMRKEKRAGAEPASLAGKNIALIFEKTSTRTRAAFEVAAHDRGAHVSYLGPGETQLGRKESMMDTARVLGRLYDGIEYRGFSQDFVETLGHHAGVPVWNGLTDQWHPTQMLADLLTITDHCDRPLEEVSVCYLGDARNNTARSLLVTAAIIGMDVRLAAPRALQPPASVQSLARELATRSGARIHISDDPEASVRGVDFLYTDVWLSMGEPEEKWDERIDQLLPFQINAALVRDTGNAAVKFLHCLPAMHSVDTEVGRALFARRGLAALEVTDDVFESPASLVFDEAENRLHTIKAVMVATLGDGQ